MDSLIISAINILILRTPAIRRRQKSERCDLKAGQAAAPVAVKMGCETLSLSLQLPGLCLVLRALFNIHGWRDRSRELPCSAPEPVHEEVLPNAIVS
jgi:hypothetical protein